MIAERSPSASPSREMSRDVGNTNADNVISPPANDPIRTELPEQSQIAKQPERSSMQSAFISKSILSVASTSFLIPVVVALLFPALSLRAATGGSISGTVADPSGAVVAGATLRLINTAQQTNYQVVSDRQGLYGFPNLPVGRYDLTITDAGFRAQKKMNLAVDTDSALRVDIALAIGQQSDTVTVTSVAGVQVDTAATHLGEVVSGPQMSALP
jgi:hypothetical protein